MNSWHGVVVSIGVCLAATVQAQGVIHFQGAIVERSCAGGLQPGSTLKMSCPVPLPSSALNVERVTGAGKPVRLRAVRGEEGQYQLVDSAGARIRTGSYLITLTSP
ncbi:type 1 fimbrial protein [Pseudomonas fontis]|uniref:Type 1 fimbrial protein n=1 Tax=Pseudomonas fontis TaxID=2942633 RepID=A0ABT5NPU6_9PSED|nr:type 1 fimbrial protein [Pseudomonas fontis]MDD0972365.1 type 1 fimbrial protein [Pseudomonas fontis]MDD0990178.1 type 1 fimbrial protein [Pseudomonas fontis]